MTSGCRLWTEGVPAWGGRRTAAVSDLPEAGAAEALRAACGRARAAGFGAVVGPMRGDTWHAHRVVVETDGSPPFFGEPDAPRAWAAAFLDAGFDRIATYASAATGDLAVEDPRLARVEARLAAGGLRFRPLDLGDPAADLRAMHGLCLRAFAHNFLYRPLPEEDFLRMYAPLAGGGGGGGGRGGVLRPELVELVEAGGELVGLCFALPDPLEAARGGTPRTVVLKTLAREPGRRAAGLGSLLVQRTRKRAAQLGFSRVVHALMHERNDSLNLATGAAGGHAGVFRRYALYGRTLP